MSAPLPRKQARQARARATRDAIVQAAAHILEEDGNARLTTNRVAERAGVSIGSLYQYYPNKEAILADLIRDKRAHLLAGMQQAVAEARGAPADDALRALIRAAMVWQVERPALSREVEHLAQRLSLEAETETLSREMAGLVLEVAQRIAPAVGETEARDAVAIVKGLIAAALQDGDPGGEALVDRAVRAARGYLRECSAAMGENPPSRTISVQFDGHTV